MYFWKPFKCFSKLNVPNKQYIYLLWVIRAQCPIISPCMQAAVDLKQEKPEPVETQWNLSSRLSGPQLGSPFGPHISPAVSHSGPIWVCCLQASFWLLNSSSTINDIKKRTVSLYLEAEVFVFTGFWIVSAITDIHPSYSEKGIAFI